MKSIQIWFYILIIASIFACIHTIEKPPKLLLQSNIVSYKQGEYSTNIFVSNCILKITNHEVAHATFKSMGSTTRIWVKGIETKHLPSSQTQPLQKYNVEDLIYKTSDVKNISRKEHLCAATPDNENYLVSKISKNNTLIQAYYLNGDNYINICKNNKSQKIKLDNSESIAPVKIQLYDITGDGKEELFVFIPVFDYWDGDAYTISVFAID